VITLLAVTVTGVVVAVIARLMGEIAVITGSLMLKKST